MSSPLTKILRATQAPHSDLFHDLRRSLITEWINSGTVAEAIIVEWVGNSERVAREFYNQVLEQSVAKITGSTPAAPAAEQLTKPSSDNGPGPGTSKR